MQRCVHWCAGQQLTAVPHATRGNSLSLSHETILLLPVPSRHGMAFFTTPVRRNGVIRLQREQPAEASSYNHYKTVVLPNHSCGTRQTRFTVHRHCTVLSRATRWFDGVMMQCWVEQPLPTV
jgi:hypothetical protein